MLLVGFATLGWALLPSPCQPSHLISRSHVKLLASGGDPFRSDRPPIEPMCINAIQKLLADGAVATDVAAGAVKDRAADPDYALTLVEAELLKQRVLRVDAAQDALYTLLELAVAATPWVTRFGAEAQFGIGKPSDPYVRLCRAECMLALVILHVEQRAVDFLEEERLEVLRDAVPSDAVDAVRAAAASIPDS